MRPSRSLSVVVAAGVGLFVAAPAATAAPTHRLPQRVAGTVTSATLGGGRLVTPRWDRSPGALATAARAAAPLPARRSGVRGHAAGTAVAPADIALGAQSRGTGLVPLVAAAPVGSEQILSEFSDFQGVSIGVYPPDDAVASSGTEVVHAVNGGLVAAGVDGTFLGVASLASLFLPDSGYSVSDPQMVFDSAAGRWVFTAVEYNTSTTYDSKVLMLVSTGPDLATATLNRFVPAALGSFLLDQPRLGITSDKLLITTQDFSSGPAFVGPDEYVLDKADAYSAPGTTIDVTSRFDYPPEFGIAPAVNSSTGSTGYFVTTGAAPSNNLRVVAVTGVPGSATDTAFHAVDQSLGLPTAAPAAARAPSGVTIDAGDERMQAVSWFNGSLMAVTSQPCVPYMDFTARACLRFWRVNTSTLTLAEDKVVGVTGIDLSAPAGIQDRVGGIHFAATASSTALSPSLVTFARPAGAAWDTDLTYVVQPTDDYVGFGSGTQRWGDYTGMAVDPLRPADVWIAGEHVDMTTSSPPNWMTSFARVSAAPHVVGIARSASTVAPAGAVTLTGSLTRPGGQPVAGETLSLWKKPHTSLVWGLATSGVTSAAGTVTYVDHPSVNEDYQWRYAGVSAAGSDPAITSEFTAPAASAATTVLVAPKVSIASNKTAMVHGSTVTFSGVVSPNHSGKRVYLQRYLGRGRWANVTYRALSTSSTYAFAVTIATRGTFSYRVWFVADADHTNGFSVAKAIKVT